MTCPFGWRKSWKKKMKIKIRNNPFYAKFPTHQTASGVESPPGCFVAWNGFLRLHPLRSWRTWTHWVWKIKHTSQILILHATHSAMKSQQFFFVTTRVNSRENTLYCNMNCMLLYLFFLLLSSLFHPFNPEWDWSKLSK